MPYLVCIMKMPLMSGFVMYMSLLVINSIYNACFLPKKEYVCNWEYIDIPFFFLNKPIYLIFSTSYVSLKSLEASKYVV